jgi:uncharacterized protein (DUF885 family)
VIKNIFVKMTMAATLFAIALLGCKKETAGRAQEMGRDDAAFTIYENSFLEHLWKLNPDWATSVGYHKYDSLLFIPNQQSRDKMQDFVKVNMDSLSRFDVNTLNEGNRVDYNMMQNQLDYAQWQIKQLKAYEWDPSSYNVVGTFAYILNEHYAPLAQRLRHFYQRMVNVPLFYKDAEKQIKNPVAELTSLAIEQNLGGVDVIGKDFADSLQKSSIPQAEQKLMTDRAAITVKAIKDYAEWLKNLKNDHPRSFRLGRDLYEDKFKYEIVAANTAQQVFNAATQRKKYVHQQMAKLTKQLWPKYFGKATMPADSLDMVKQMIDTLSANHVKPSDFQSAIVQLIPKLNNFVKAKDLLTLDASKPLIIRKEPGYMAGVAGASMSGPGPYDKDGNSYYNVGSLAGWSKEKAESYLREYNQYIIQILSIHEAVPGHYVQGVYANKAPSVIKAVFGNGAMAEGWAVYSEEMMLNAGYGNNEPEMLLMWYKWNLRSVCNTILDYSVHSGSMTKEQAIKMLTTEAFQQQAEADGKWKRVSVSSVQLTSYYTGYKEIMDLRDNWKDKMGDKYTLKSFNEKFLSYGSAPVKFIKDAMMAKQATGKK